MKNTANSFLIGTFSDENKITLPVKGREGGISSRGFYHGLIISSGVATTQHEQKLTRLAEIAYGQRNIPALERLSFELCSLPSGSARDAGMYYAAIVAKRNGQVEFARSMLESLVDSPTIGARATQTLGALYYDTGRAEQAMPLFAKAARSNDPFAKLCGLLQSTAIKSQAGNHQAALDELQALWPLARALALAHSHVFPFYHNELAYELAQVGRLQEAAKHSAIACASPVASAYSEWQETREEIKQEIAAREAAPLLFVVPDLKREKKKEKSKAHFDTLIFLLRPGHSEQLSLPTYTGLAPVGLTLSRLECCLSRRGPPSPFRE